MSVRVVLFLVIALVHVPASARNVQCIALDDVPNAEGTPIPSERILRVPSQQQAHAFALLGKRALAQLTASQVEEILSQMPISIEAMLNNEAREADQKAEGCRQLAAEPFFADSKERNLRGALSYEQYAAYLRGLQPSELLPYLVDTKVYAEGTGAYWASFKDHQLRVAHGSLGRGPMEAKHIAVIVFVESPIDNVTVSVSAAE